ncbi:type IV pilin protein [Deinococcus sp.]|uniref:type IV pilin protein n=1 Tax=Deinococcus sp. TaxID=47478 RepID=UPI003CC5AFDB
MIRRVPGFTLIELLTAVAIIAVLAVILIPSYLGATATGDKRVAPDQRRGAGAGTGHHSQPARHRRVLCG